jgi:hypothetical protein
MAKPVQLRVLCWNVYVGNKPRRVRAALLLLAALFWPHVICLQEARRFTGTIPGYRRLAADTLDRDDATQNIILVRRGLTILEHGPIAVPGNGWTYNGHRKPARTFYSLVLTAPSGLVWRILNVHRCVGGPRGNSPGEWEREDYEIETWADDPFLIDDPTVIVGDHNDDFKLADEDRSGTTADLAQRIGADALTVDDDEIDYALIRDCGGTIRQFPNKLGSDTHAPMLITLTAPRPDVIARRIKKEETL